MVFQVIVEEVVLEVLVDLQEVLLVTEEVEVDAWVGFVVTEEVLDVLNVLLLVLQIKCRQLYKMSLKEKF